MSPYDVKGDQGGVVYRVRTASESQCSERRLCVCYHIILVLSDKRGSLLTMHQGGVVISDDEEKCNEVTNNCS